MPGISMKRSPRTLAHVHGAFDRDHTQATGASVPVSGDAILRVAHAGGAGQIDTQTTFLGFYGEANRRFRLQSDAHRSGAGEYVQIELRTLVEIQIDIAVFGVNARILEKASREMEVAIFHFDV